MATRPIVRRSLVDSRTNERPTGRYVNQERVLPPSAPSDDPVRRAANRVSRTTSKALRAFRVLRDEGARGFLARAAGKLHSSMTRRESIMLVSREDAAAVDWTEHPVRLREPVAVGAGPMRLAWIMSPPGRESGGHQNLFRFIDFASRAGHVCTAYLYNANDNPVSIADIKSMLRSTAAYPDLDIPLAMYDRATGVGDADVIVATGWETAYPAYLDGSHAHRLYFVQDYEPSFYTPGSEALLAENTYRFGFHGLTAGRWLSSELGRRYGMSTDHFDFGVDRSRYFVTNTGPRDEIFFYARPVTPRRAFEFGLLALADFARMRPDVTINFAGWDVSNWDVPFPYRNHASLDISQLNEIYNRCAAGLVLSLTNMSLLPLELISSGVTPVVNEGPNNRMVSDNPYIEYVEPSPRAIARRLVEVLERPDAAARSQAMSASVASVDWEASGEQFLAALERAVRG